MSNDNLSAVFSIVTCIGVPVVLTILGLVVRAIFRSKGYPGWVGFALGFVGGLVGLVIALVLPKSKPSSAPPPLASSPGTSSSQVPADRLARAEVAQSFTEKDNLGTNYDTQGRGDSYWRSRMMQGQEYPFVIYYFENENNAREALLELPCIHMAQDSQRLICTEVLDFGCYLTKDGAYTAFICGKDLTYELWEEAKTSFAQHGGTFRNEQEPERLSTPLQAAITARPDKVVFVKEVRGQGQMGESYIKKKYSAPDAVSAKAFLQQHPVTEQFYYIEIETPEGNYGRDIQGIYSY